MKRDLVSVGEYYHVLNRGVNKQIIFHDKKDWDRFIFLIMLFQSPINFTNISRLTEKFMENVQHPVLNIQGVIDKRIVELVCFCVMPNHFHLILKEEVEGGIAQYMQRVLNAYAKYYNTKYQKSGHLFQGPYKSVHINTNEQLLHLSAYIHKNPIELQIWKNKISSYYYSSYMDYIGENRWRGLLTINIIKDQFKNGKEYDDFVLSSSAKLLDEKMYLY